MNRSRPVIEKEVRKIKGGYTKTAGQYLATWTRPCRNSASAERGITRERDWYPRSGWIWVNFMKASTHRRRNDAGAAAVVRRRIAVAFQHRPDGMPANDGATGMAARRLRDAVGSRLSG